MTALDRLRELRRSMQLALVLRATMIALSVIAVAFVLLSVISTRGVALAVAIVAGLAASIRPLLTIARVRSLSTVALWVEEGEPELRYSLVTAAEGSASPLLESQALALPWWSDARRRVARSLVAPGAAFVIVMTIALWNPLRGVSLDWRNGLTTGGAGKDATVDVLSGLRAVVTPPAYASREAATIDDPTSVEALIGSTITLSGRGDAARLKFIVDSATKNVTAGDDGWRVSVSMPTRPAVARLKAADGRERILVLAPVVDAIPAVTLTTPAHDTIVRAAKGILRLHADLRDDIGLRDAAFEIVISSGGGENFTFRSATLARSAFNGRAEGSLDSRLSLDSLALKPGDILQLRAIAHDANNVTGPGLGASDTRAIRVARADEYDSLSIEALPPPEAETQALSQRMLINLTEALVKKQRSLAKDMLIGESRKLAGDQRKLRKKVGDIVFQRLGAEPLSEEGSDDAEGGKLTAEQILKMADSVTSTAGVVMDVEGDETPILALNKPLLEAFNAMWDAGRSLEIGEPAKALPPMRIALAAIERARMAERIYLRGRTKTPIVDIPKVRLSGKDKGKASIREPRLPVDPKMRRRAETFERVSELMAKNPEAAADSLLIMRVDALGDAPALATALDEAARALRKRDTSAITLAWVRVRRALSGGPMQRAGLRSWLGAP
jgi:hypothetical protein